MIPAIPAAFPPTTYSKLAFSFGETEAGGDETTTGFSTGGGGGTVNRDGSAIGTTSSFLSTVSEVTSGFAITTGRGDGCAWVCACNPDSSLERDSIRDRFLLEITREIIDKAGKNNTISRPNKTRISSIPTSRNIHDKKRSTSDLIREEKGEQKQKSFD